LDRLERGEFGPMWTNTGKAEMKTIINLNKTLLRGVLEELENTKTPIAVART